MKEKDATEKIPRHEWWRRQYRENRYLVGLTKDELYLRLADIMTNQTTLTDEGKIGIAGIHWLERFTHVAEEFCIRPLSWPAIRTMGDRVAIPKPETPTIGPMIRARYPKGIPERFMLFKYGKREHLKPLLDKGAIRLCPASFYDAASLNAATRDKELEFEKIVGYSRYRYRSSRDFYMFCSSMIHFDRLLWDFQADSVLLIHDPKAFFIRLATALNEQSLKIYFNKVAYLDPVLLGATTHVRDVALVKHFRFAYQFEHRFIAMSQNEDPLSIRHLQLGSLQDIAELLGPPHIEQSAA